MPEKGDTESHSKSFDLILHIESYFVALQKQEGKKGKGLGEPRSGTDNAKTDVEVRNVAIAPVARRRTTNPRIEGPGTATFYPGRAFIAR